MKEKITSIGALISAGFASICCLGPLLLVGLGLGGAGLAAGFARYRPIFLGLTAVFLGVAFYQTYRKRKIACADGTCELRSGSRTMKTSLWVVAALVLGLATFHNWSPYLFGKSAIPSSVQGETLTLKISGMFCSACAVGIEKSLDKVPGVQAASVNFDKEEAILVVGSEGVDINEALSAVKSAGPYSAHVKENRP